MQTCTRSWRQGRQMFSSSGSPVESDLAVFWQPRLRRPRRPAAGGCEVDTALRAQTRCRMGPLLHGGFSAWVQVELRLTCGSVEMEVPRTAAVTGWPEASRRAKQRSTPTPAPERPARCSRSSSGPRPAGSGIARPVRKPDGRWCSALTLHAANQLQSPKRGETEMKAQRSHREQRVKHSSTDRSQRSRPLLMGSCQVPL